MAESGVSAFINALRGVGAQQTGSTGSGDSIQKALAVEGIKQRGATTRHGMTQRYDLQKHSIDKQHLQNLRKIDRDADVIKARQKRKDEGQKGYDNAFVKLYTKDIKAYDELRKKHPKARKRISYNTFIASLKASESAKAPYAHMLPSIRKVTPEDDAGADNVRHGYVLESPDFAWTQPATEIFRHAEVEHDRGKLLYDEYGKVLTSIRQNPREPEKWYRSASTGIHAEVQGTKIRFNFEDQKNILDDYIKVVQRFGTTGAFNIYYNRARKIAAKNNADPTLLKVDQQSSQNAEEQVESGVKVEPIDKKKGFVTSKRPEPLFKGLKKAGKKTFSQDQQRTQMQTYDYLSRQGLNKVQIAAIMGAISGESSFNKDEVGDNGKAHGLLQINEEFNPAVRNIDPYDVEQNLGYVLNTLGTLRDNERKEDLSLLNNKEFMNPNVTLKDASRILIDKYIRPGSGTGTPVRKTAHTKYLTYSKSFLKSLNKGDESKEISPVNMSVTALNKVMSKAVSRENIQKTKDSLFEALTKSQIIPKQLYSNTLLYDVAREKSMFKGIITAEHLEKYPNPEDVPKDTKEALGESIRDKHTEFRKNNKDSSEVLQNVQIKQQKAGKGNEVVYVGGSNSIKYNGEVYAYPAITDFSDKELRDSWKSTVINENRQSGLAKREGSGLTPDLAALYELGGINAYLKTLGPAGWNPDIQKYQSTNAKHAQASTKMLEGFLQDSYKWRSKIKALIHKIRNVRSPYGQSVIVVPPSNFDAIITDPELKTQLEQATKDKSLFLERHGYVKAKTIHKNGKPVIVYNKVDKSKLKDPQVGKSDTIVQHSVLSMPDHNGVQKPFRVATNYNPSGQQWSALVDGGKLARLGPITPDGNVQGAGDLYGPVEPLPDTEFFQLQKILNDGQQLISSVRAGGSDAAKSAEQLVKLTKDPLIKQYLPQITTKFLDAVAFSTAQDAVKNQENDPHTIELSDITATLKSGSYKQLSHKQLVALPAHKEAEQVNQFGHNAIMLTSYLLDTEDEMINYKLRDMQDDIHNAPASLRTFYSKYLENIQTGEGGDNLVDRLKAIAEDEKNPDSKAARHLYTKLKRETGSSLSDQAGWMHTLVTKGTSIIQGLKDVFGKTFADVVNSSKQFGTDKSSWFNSDVGDRAVSLSVRLENGTVLNRDGIDEKLQGFQERAINNYNAAMNAAEKDHAKGSAGYINARREAFLAARKQLLAITLTYQFAGMVQGGSGGRAISNEDFQYLYKALWGGGGEITGYNLLAARDIIQDALDRARYYKGALQWGDEVAESVLESVKHVQRARFKARRREETDSLGYLFMGANKSKTSPEDAARVLPRANKFIHDFIPTSKMRGFHADKIKRLSKDMAANVYGTALEQYPIISEDNVFTTATSVKNAFRDSIKAESPDTSEENEKTFNILEQSVNLNIINTYFRPPSAYSKFLVYRGHKFSVARKNQDTGKYIRDANNRIRRFELSKEERDSYIGKSFGTLYADANDGDENAQLIVRHLIERLWVAGIDRATIQGKN